ncbi:MAG TPA: hypothetical protein VLM79_36665 [Kofleriaceae bacterium]|nr:hypothetical protein [Kofleriaceae bacterium]
MSRPGLSAVSATCDRELDRIAQIIRPSVRIHDRTDLEALLGRLLEAAEEDAPAAPRTLDLIGHSTQGSLLRLGDWVIDGTSTRVKAFFRGLAEHDVMSRLGIRALRLLGCNSAGAGLGESTMTTLAAILGIEVQGTTHLLHECHYDAGGFQAIWDFMLVSSKDLQLSATTNAAMPDTARWPRTLDIDALPALRLGLHPAPWPQRLASASAMRQILALIRRNAGARMPGLIALPSCELALPSAMRGAYHFLHVLFDGAFVRCFPDGVDVPGVVYPVDDAPGLHRIVHELPLVDLSR